MHQTAPADASGASTAHVLDAARSPAESRVTSILSATLALTLGLLTAGLVLAMAGLHHAVLQGPLALVCAVFLYRLLPQAGAIRPLPRYCALALGLVVVAVVLSNLALRSDLVVAGRDGGTYANTASFLVDGAGLFPEAIGEPFAGQDELEFRAPGFVVRDDGSFYQQFLHSTPAMYAFFGELFGRGALFGVNAFVAGVGVLAIFAVAARFVRPWWALLAAVLTATTLPYAYYSRGTFSEIATLVLIAGGLWTAHLALSTQPQLSLGAGLLLGGAAMVRVDAWMIAIALALLLMTTTWMGEGRTTWAASRIFAGFIIAAALGLIDLVLFAEPYLNNVGKLLLALIVVAAGLRATAPLMASPQLRRLAEFSQRHHRPIANALAVLIVAFFAYTWLVRPLLPPSRSATVYGLEAIQIQEGIAVEPDRAYTELSVWWLSWYVGIPLLLLGCAGFIGAARRSLVAGNAPLRLMVLAFAVPAVTYIIRPSVNPDQIWAIRRFLPVVLPGIVVLAIATMAWSLGRLGSSDRSRWLGGLVAAVAVVPLLLTSAPLIAKSDRAGVAAQFAQLCDGLGDARSVLLVNDDPDLPLTWLIGPPLRSWCGVSVAGANPGQEVRVEVDAVIATVPELLPKPADFSIELAAEAWEATLTAPPDDRDRRTVDVHVVHNR